jgi:hypothetical protein
MEEIEEGILSLLKYTFELHSAIKKKETDKITYLFENIYSILKWGIIVENRRNANWLNENKEFREYIQSIQKTALKCGIIGFNDLMLDTPIEFNIYNKQFLRALERYGLFKDFKNGELRLSQLTIDTLQNI